MGIRYQVSRQWPTKLIKGRWYKRGLTYPTIELAEKAKNPGDRRLGTTLYHPMAIVSVPTPH